MDRSWTAAAILLIGSFALPAAAGTLIAQDDRFSVPASGFLAVESLGVLENDTLDGEAVGVTASIVSSPQFGSLSCGDNPSLEICADGSFEYLPDEFFTGSDSFQYQAIGSGGETAVATVTLEACSTDGATGVVTCWQEAPFLDRLTTLNLFRESFEGTAWDALRLPDTAMSVSSNNITWTTNFPGDNPLTTGDSSARSGNWALFDRWHGLAADTNPANCDIDNPPDSCRPFDGFSGDAGSLQLQAVGGYISSVTTGSNIAILIDNTELHAIGKMKSPAHQFFGLIDGRGFSRFSFRELDGKTGQELPIFGDDFVFATAQALPPNSAPVLAPIGDRSIAENSLLIIDVTASDADGGDVLAFTVTGLPPGAGWQDVGSGQGRITWQPGYDQAGSYSVQVEVADNAVPPKTDAETFMITVMDTNRAPVLTTIGDRSVNAGQLLSFTITATDPDGDAMSFAKDAGAPGSTLTDNQDGTALFEWTPDAVHAGTNPVVFTVTDNATSPASDSETVNITVVVPDTVPPVITLLGANPDSVPQGGSYVDPGATAVDDVDGDISVNIVVTGTVNTAVPGSYNLLYQVSDQAGNAASATRVVEVLADTDPPVVTAPAPITVAATDASGTVATDPAISAFLAGASANDAIDGSRTISHDAPDPFPLGVTLVTFSASDTAGNIGTAQSTVTVSDQTPPVITLNGTASMTLNTGDAYVEPGATALDNVDGPVTVSISGSVNTAIPGNYSIRYDAVDAAGNGSFVTRSITVQDADAPVVDAPAPITVAATDASGTAASDPAISAFLAAASANDAIDGNITPVNNDAPTQFPLGVILVTFTATDSAGNTGSAQSTVTVTDQTPPVITLNGTASMTLNTSDTYVEPGATALDNVDGSVPVSISGSVNTAIPGNYSIRYDAVDAAGNGSFATRSITVQDADAPVVDAPAPITVAATDASGTAASDPAISAFLAGASANDAIDGSRPVSHNAPTQFPLGVTNVTFTATDTAGNTGSSQSTVTVIDQTPPVISLNGSASMTLNIGDSYIEASATAVDNVDGPVAVTHSGTVDTSTPGLYKIHYSASDQVGNTSQATRNVTVQDAAAPVVTAPSPITVAAMGASGTAASTPAIASFLVAATANDAVDGAVPVSHDAPTQFPLGVTNVTFTATDSVGNTGTAQSSVIVIDQTPPAISLNGTASMTLNTGDTYVEPSATALDNVDGSVPVSISGNVNTAIPGNYSIRYNAIDAAGNSSFVTRSITVQDAGAPVVSAPAPITVAATDGSGIAASDPAISAFLAGASANDAIDGSRPVSHNAPTQFPLGVTSVTFSASDTAGNTGSAQSTVTVIDQTPPVITLNGTASMTLNIGDAYDEPGASALDNVDGSVTVSISGSVNTDIPGNYSIRYEAVDEANNSSFVTRSIIVQDVKPRAEFQPDQKAEPGAEITVRVYLVGGSRARPAEFHYRVTGQSTGLVLVGETIVSLAPGQREAVIPYRLPNDLEENGVVFELLDGGNVLPGNRRQHVVALVSENLAPLVRLQLDQAGSRTRTVVSSAGPVSVEALVTDVNVGDTHRFDWSASDDRLPIPAQDEASWMLDPSGLQPGEYKLGVKVTDSGNPMLDVEQELLFRVLATAPVLDAAADSDDDGMDDRSEGYGDSDEDGIPDYLDGLEEPHELPAQFDSPQLVMQTEPGLSLRLGSAAYASEQVSAGISMESLGNLWQQSGISGPDPGDDAYTYPEGLFDFELHGLSWAGQSVRIVIPLLTGLEDGAVYRKYQSSGWQDLVTDAVNSIASAKRVDDLCPPPGSSLYRDGLNAGDDCIQLQLQDGGPNDADDQPNGVIRDPGGVASPVTASGGGSSGGGSGGGGALLPGWLWLLLTVWSIRRFRIHRSLHRHRGIRS